MSDRKGGGVSIYIHKSLDFIVKLDLSINNNDIESLTIEILSNKKETLYLMLSTDHLMVK